MFDGLLLDVGALGEDLPIAAKVGVGGRHIAQALMVALVIIVLDERLDLGFEIARQVVVLQQDAVLQGLVPTFNLALRLRSMRRWLPGQRRSKLGQRLGWQS